MSENIAEMMKNTIAAVMGTGEKEYIVKGAKLKCTLGSTPSLLNLPICHGAYATGQPLIHANDNTPIKNILPFGTCPVLGGPCVPSIVGPWLNTHEKLMIADAAPGGPSFPAVTMKSFLVCSNGGIIEPKKSGQEYKTPGTAKTLEGQGTSQTRVLAATTEADSPSPDDWRYFGENGNELNSTSGADPKFGEDISTMPALPQAQMQLHLVDRIARVLFEEHTTSFLSQEAIAWCMLNRCVKQNRDLLYTVTYKDQYEIFTQGNTPVALNPSSTFTDNSSGQKCKAGWEHSLEVAKKLVSIACQPGYDQMELVKNPYYDLEFKIDFGDQNTLIGPEQINRENLGPEKIDIRQFIFDQWVPNPFLKINYKKRQHEVMGVKGIPEPFLFDAHVGTSGWGQKTHELRIPNWIKFGDKTIEDKSWNGFYNMDEH